ncbi:MAG: hypothetical protein ABFS16_07255 [Bacteroidota bacterium]
MKIKKHLLFLFSLTIFIFSFTNCNKHKNNFPVVIDFSTKEARDEFSKLELDSLYINLLNTVTNEQEGDTLYQRWLDFNSQLADTVKANNFNWGTKDSSVIIWNRVYCAENGKIEYYLYNIVDSTISQDQKVAYGAFIKTKLPLLKYNVQREYKYAQCGSWRHYTY